jgi:hypothetical protein
MLAGMTTTRQHLLAWVHAHGLAALDELFREEAVALAGPKGRHQPQRTHHHWGTAATELTFGGRRVQVHRPRVRQTAGGEATLPSVAAFRDRDPLTADRADDAAEYVPKRELARVRRWIRRYRADAANGRGVMGLLRRYFAGVEARGRRASRRAAG